jgi:hypothetical protein
MNRTSIRLALAALLNLALAISSIGLVGCSGRESPKAGAASKFFSKRFADSGDSPAGKARVKEGPRQK